MKIFYLAIILFGVGFTACKEKKEDEKKKFISIRSYIDNQVASVDTSLYAILKLDIIDSTRTDTTYHRREEFRSLAKEFLDLPDIADRKNSKQYREEVHFDETLNRVIIDYLPIDPKNALIQRQEMLITPSPDNDKVTSIFVDYLINTKDSIIQKKMLWRVDRSFQITTIRQKPGQEETVSTRKVIWNEPQSE